MNNIVEQVFLQIVANVMFGGNIECVLVYEEEDRFFRAIGADSLDIIQIVIALKNTFDIKITDEEVEDFAKMSCNEILYMLESAGASAESMQRKLARKQKKQVQETPKPVVDKEQTQKIEFKTILHQAENLVASIKLFETAQNNITAPSKQQPKPAIELRTMKDGKPYCELLGKKCNRPERPNNTGKVYCEFMNCRIYNNFQRLR